MNLKKGDIISLKKPLISGWRGRGIVTYDQHDDLVIFRKEGDCSGWINDRNIVLRCEVTKIK